MSGQAQYDPVPWSTDHADDVPYNRAASPDTRNSAYATPETQPLELHEDLPAGAARPRFMGAALATDGPNPRNSIASSQNSFPIQDDYNSSVYALNAEGSHSSRDPTFYSLNYRDDPHDGDFNDSQAQFGKGSPAMMQSSPYLSEKRNAYAAPKARSRRMFIIAGAILGLIILVAVILGVYFGVVKPKSNNEQDASGSLGDSKTSAKPSSSASPGSRVVVTGGDGSTVTMDDGTTFTYQNSFGGTWYWDPEDPFNNGARAQSFSPALNETFRYGIDQIRGVNLGGWLNTEPFISPALYEKYANLSNPAIDEWTLSENMRADTAGGGINQLEDHYKTFITEQDFAEIAAAGLNWVRIPIAFWAIEVWDGEPFLAKTSWKYFLKAIQWARKYGIRINLDLHAVPGSQNGWNHSGKFGTINLLNGPMGIANAQRTLDYIRIFAEFISQPQYRDVVPMFGIINEPQAAQVFGQENLLRFYLEGYNIVRQASGVGEGNGPMISLHDGFFGFAKWEGTFVNADRTSLDIHPYLCFGDQSDATYAQRAKDPCNAWANNQNTSMSNFGMSSAGEWSNAINDCGLYVNGVNLGTRYEGNYTPGTWPRIGSCDQWNDWTTWDSSLKKDIKNLALASMDALQHYFFWTWKIGNSSVTGKVEAPFWSYKLGLEQGWMPKDPRDAIGTCGGASPFKGPLESWQTGGAGADKLQATFTSSYAWPPTAITSAGAASLLPTYTPSGTVVTLPGPTFTQSAGSTVDAGNGWQNTASDTASNNVPIATCSYLDPWVGPTAAPPSPLCSGGTARRDEIPPPVITGRSRFRK